MTFNLALPFWLRRRAPPHAAPPSTLELLAGQRRDLALAPGDGFRLAAGELALLRPPRWLADALVAALTTWPRDGIPKNPQGWLLTAARNRLLDLARHQQVHEHNTPTLKLMMREFDETADPDRYGITPGDYLI